VCVCFKIVLWCGIVSVCVWVFVSESVEFMCCVWRVICSVCFMVCVV